MLNLRVTVRATSKIRKAGNALRLNRYKFMLRMALKLEKRIYIFVTSNLVNLYVHVCKLEMFLGKVMYAKSKVKLR